MIFVRSDVEHAGAIAVRHAIHYRSSVPIDDDIFDVFARGNVQFHVWPFVREFVQSATQRFGWQPFTLPTFLSSDDNEDETDEARSSNDESE